jgi:hypothetical protein
MPDLENHMVINDTEAYEQSIGDPYRPRLNFKLINGIPEPVVEFDEDDYEDDEQTP